MITKEITIEELVENVRGSVKYLMEQGIRCIICGESIWGTLEEAAIEKGFTQEQIAVFVADLNEIRQNPPGADVKFEKRFNFDNRPE